MHASVTASWLALGSRALGSRSKGVGTDVSGAHGIVRILRHLVQARHLELVLLWVKKTTPSMVFFLACFSIPDNKNALQTSLYPRRVACVVILFLYYTSACSRGYLELKIISVLFGS
jgi:hypothetical protein